MEVPSPSFTIAQVPSIIKIKAQETKKIKKSNHNYQYPI
jgi:hypothetical protein